MIDENLREFFPPPVLSLPLLLLLTGEGVVVSGGAVGEGVVVGVFVVPAVVDGVVVGDVVGAEV